MSNDSEFIFTHKCFWSNHKPDTVNQFIIASDLFFRDNREEQKNRVNISPHGSIMKISYSSE